MKMTDPIQGAIISICLSDLATGSKLERLKLQPSVDFRTALKVDDDVLHYTVEHLKSLTMAELKEALANAVEI